MEKYKVLLLAFILCVIFISCQDTGFDYYSSNSSSSSRHPRGSPPAPTTQPAYFPNKIGSQWKYAVSGVTKSMLGDTVSVTIDTLIISVVDSIRFSNGQSAMAWQYRYLHSIEIHYVVIVGDTILFTTLPTSPSYDTVLVFPLSEGKTWTTDYFGTFSVHVMNNIIVPADTFTHGYLIREDYGEPNYSQISYRWFVPHVGTVRYDFESHCTLCATSSIFYTWKLLGYTVK